MIKGVVKFFKVYPLPIFVLLLTFAIYYSIFEIVRSDKDSFDKSAITEEESMLAQSSDVNSTREITVGVQDEIPKVVPQLPDDSININNSFSYVASKVKSLNIRKLPNTTSEVVGKLTPSMRAAVLEDLGEWVRISYDDTVGWVLKSYTISANNSDDDNMKLTNNTKELLKEKENKVFYTSSVPSLNIRKLPNTTSEVVGKLTPSMRAAVLEDLGEWVRVEFDGNGAGYVIKKYIKKGDNLESVNKPQYNMTKEIIDVSSSESKEFYTSLVPRLNVRDTPSINGVIVDKLTPLDKVEILETMEEWVKIRGTKNGWVVKRSLKKM